MELTVRFPNGMGLKAQRTALQMIAKKVEKGAVVGSLLGVQWAFGAELGVEYQGDIPHRVTAKDAEAEATRIRNAYRASAVFVLITESVRPRLGHTGSVGFEDLEEMRVTLQAYLDQSIVGRGRA